MPQYTVKQGDCILSIAEDFGFAYETIWNHPNNADLKQKRNDPTILFAGDAVFVPDKTPRIEDKPVDELHKFVKKVAKAKVRLRLMDLKRQPRPSLPYVATVDGENMEGESDGDGYITLQVRPNAKHLTLKITEGDKTDTYELPLGSVDPITELTGVQQRLVNLGYPCGSEMGTLGDITKAAIRAFQKEAGLPETGDPDDATRAKLKELHGT